MENFNLKVGMKAELEITATEDLSAVKFGSGGINVLATPAMIALMEKTSLMAVDPKLPAGFATVGTVVNVTHLAATPIGMKVKIFAELIAIEGKKLSFKVSASDEVDKIGEGFHDRFIVEVEKFNKRIYSKKAMQ